MSKKKYQIGNKEYTMKELVSLKSWQDLRETLKGTWAETPLKNLKKLQEWLGDFSQAPLRRLYILRNYLTGSGFRWGNIQHPKITSFRSRIVKEIKRRKLKLSSLLFKIAIQIYP